MSNFGAKLAEMLERRKMSQTELARTANLSDALISKWMTGQQSFVSQQYLANICLSISPNPSERAEIIRAHLLDEMTGPGSEMIDISIKGRISSVKTADQSGRSALPLRMQRMLEILGRESLTNADLRGILHGLAEMLTRPSSSAISPWATKTSL
jgi:DNA-binding Xre family transcriptional regulator